MRIALATIDVGVRARKLISRYAAGDERMYAEVMGVEYDGKTEPPPIADRAMVLRYVAANGWGYLLNDDDLTDWEQWLDEQDERAREDMAEMLDAAGGEGWNEDERWDYADPTSNY